MTGRPRRIADPDLARRLREWKQLAGISHAAVARLLGVQTSTITRSLEIKGFSSDLRGKIHDLLKTSAEEAIAKSASIDTTLRKLSNEDLLLLHKFVNLIPKAQKILKMALGRHADGEDHDER